MDAFNWEIVYRIGRVLEMGIATGVVSLTLTRSRMFLGIRRWISERSSWWGELVSCPYCIAHWIAAGFSLWSFATWGRPRAITGCLIWLVTVGISCGVSKSIFLSILTILPTKSEVTRDKPEIIPKAAA